MEYIIKDLLADTDCYDTEHVESSQTFKILEDPKHQVQSATKTG